MSQNDRGHLIGPPASTNNIQRQPFKHIKGRPMFTKHILFLHLQLPPRPLPQPSSLPTVCLHRLQYAVHSIGGRNTRGAFPVRKEGPCGVWKGHGTGMWLDSSLAITQLTSACSERICSMAIPAKHVTCTPVGLGRGDSSPIDLYNAPRACIWGRECAPTLCGKKRGAFPNQNGGPRM
jgi:hypothetical protein